MKKAVILHAYEQNSHGHWYPWLKQQLESNGYEVWLPDLPAQPDAHQTTGFLLSKKWNFDGNLVIGHSRGAVQLFNLLQNLPVDQTPQTAVFVSAFKEIITQKFDWAKPLQGLFVEPFKFEKINTRARNILFVHGDNDPYCDPNDARWLAKQLNGEFVSVKNGQHFSTSIDPGYTQFPKLIELLDERHLL